jgi:hypothetical protein
MLLQKLRFILPFLSPGESPRSFIETFNFGMALVLNFCQKVKKVGWWKEKNIFNESKVLGVHEDFKPFFDLLQFDYD